MTNTMTITAVPWPPFSEQRCVMGNEAWSVARLAQLSAGFEVMDIPLAHLNMSDKASAMFLRTLAGHVQAVINADMTKPIILDEDGEIMDGRHRVIHAIVYGLPTVRAVRFEENPTPCEVLSDR